MGTLSIQDVSYTYKGSRESHLAVQGVNLTIQEGEIVCFIGPSGCGKSTVLNMLAGLFHPTTGKIEYEQNEITGPGVDRGVVFQSYSLFPWMTAQENVILALEQVNKGVPKQELKQKAKELLELVGLDKADQKYPSQLSGGMQQRVALARMFALDSPVFLMDEPFGAVDAAVRANLQDCLVDLWSKQQKKKTIVMVTHDIDEAILLSDRIVVFSPNPGRVSETITVSIPRPRSRQSLFMSPRYMDLRAHLLTLLHGEETQAWEEKVSSL
ncbi:ABC transporter ATP-binding protein [Ammoniphilus resinae]|uniref:NitT/TauT family transport system ATP-binding protein n=1 Tax=Ammoniphilus resinae TaxID=861532 RepID=A0ABS4GQ90_9BACL|nr:ABC transporter ATP-binding protein [Ammoniphilus resinae]MBP1932434.1 NitT/TauT family transport system ATP-binding protein [Ammoniphilus resinae]